MPWRSGEPGDEPPRGTRRKRLGFALLVLCCLYLVGRAVVEVVTLDPGDTASYRHSWGGPSYFGVLAVHCVPGVAAAILLAWLLRRRRNRPGTGSASRPGRQAHADLHPDRTR